MHYEYHYYYIILLYHYQHITRNIPPYHAGIKCLAVFRHLIWHLFSMLQSELKNTVVRNVRKVKSCNEKLIDSHRNHMNNFVSLTAYLWATAHTVKFTHIYFVGDHTIKVRHEFQFGNVWLTFFMASFLLAIRDEFTMRTGKMGIED